MNKNNVQEPLISTAIAEGLLKLKKDSIKEPTKEGVNLLEITKKLSSKKFGKRG